MKTLAFLFFSLFSLSASAEYRAFLLKISKSEQDFRLVKSNLDPEQYPYYYPLKPGESITYIDTWMCWGETQMKPVCPSPREQTREPASVPTPIDQIPSEQPTK